jgi:chemotaxis response regulator CheB
VLKHDIIVIGASAGGLEAMKKLLAQLPDNFPGHALHRLACFTGVSEYIAPNT